MRKQQFLAIALLVIGFVQAASACEGKYSSELKSIKAADDKDWTTLPHGKAFMPVVQSEGARNHRVEEIQQAQGLCTFNDYLYAASIRAHGFTFADKLEAVKLAAVAQSLDPNSLEAKAIFARSMDLLVFQSQGKQLYGTLKDHTNGQETVLPVVEGAVSESERQLVQSVPYRGITTP